MMEWQRLARVGLVLALAWGAASLGTAGAGAAGLPRPSLPAGARSAPAFGVVPATPPGCHQATLALTPPAINKAIPDATLAGVPGIVTDTIATELFDSSVYVWDVNVTVNITHTFSGDLDIFLISPHGTRVTLAHHNGTSLNDIYNGATFDDQAGLTNPPGPVTMAAYGDGVPLGLVNPQEPLAAFNGENPNGNWTLEVRDNVHSDTGVLKSWSLQIAALDTAPVPINTATVDSFAQTPIPDGQGQVDRPLLMFALAPLSALTLTTVITHPATRDLVMQLITPAGVTLTVSNRNPLTLTSDFANVFAGTTFYDSAGAVNPPGPVTDNDYQTGSVETPLSPQEGFAEVNGVNPQGVWHLLVSDVVSGSVGTLGHVSLTGTGLTCEPAVETGVGATPRFPRLGAPLVIQVYVFSFGTTASNVLLTTGLAGPYSYQSVTAPDWSCAEPPVGTLSPSLNCTRNSLPITTSLISVTVTAPLAPEPAEVSAPVSSNPPGLLPPVNGTAKLVTAYAQSANGNPWDVLDSLNTAFGFQPDSGTIQNGGQDAFSGFGTLQVRALDLTGTLLSSATAQNLGLVYAPGHRWHGSPRAVGGGINVQRDILAPSGVDWLRYVDHFTNSRSTAAQVWVSWGGALGSGSQTKTAATSDGNLTLGLNDQWGVTYEQDQSNGPAVRPPVGVAFRSASDSSYLGPYIFNSIPFTQTVWPSLGNGNEGQVFKFVLQPGETRALAYFVARGLAEGTPGPDGCDFYGGCLTPATGSQVALIEQTMAALAAVPPFCDLSPVERGQIINWPQVSTTCAYLPLVVR